MTKALERDLGLYSVITVSIGAMIGSGIFVLPGIASTIAGPAVVLAYFLAGLMVLPAALSQAEMASAMPRSGGAYLYIERATGPMLGTIAGIGVWFSLVFKSAFALVGLGAYLVFFTESSPKLVGLLLAAGLSLVNVLGVKQSGRLQVIVVTGALTVLVAFIVNGVTYVEATNLHPFMPEGIGGLLAATGFVFVSYAGVTKIASIAEEIENPGRNIPLGILVSITFMMVVYSLVVLVIVGVTSPDELGRTLTPMAAAAGQFLGEVGEIVIATTAILALVSMANAGILSSSRYPFAMGRDNLAPAFLGGVSARFRTPAAAIVLTGGTLLVLIAFVPVADLAKLASAFQFLVFALINLALIVFRESEIESYAPAFVAPGYPWVQLIGIFGSIVFLTQMGSLALGGAIGIVFVGAAWYRYYARHRTEREGAATGTVRQATERYSLETTRTILATKSWQRILVAIQPPAHASDEEVLLRIGAHLASADDAQVEVARFEEVPDQITLDAAAEEMTTEDVEFERDIDRIAQHLDARVDKGEIVSHDARRAVVNFARRRQSDLIVAEWRSGFTRWLMSHAPCDLVFVRSRGWKEPASLAVVADRGPYDPLELAVAAALARSTKAGVEFLYAVDGGVGQQRVDSIEKYHAELRELFPSSSGSRILRAGDRTSALVSATADHDLAIMSESAHHFLYDVVFGDIPDRVADEASCSVILVHTQKPFRHTFLRWIVERIAY